MYLQDFKYYQPESLEEAFKLLEESKNGAPLAGGTDMLVEIKKGLRQQDEVISLQKIKELKVIMANFISVLVPLITKLRIHP